jgi:peptide/nickel transport system permease protein
MTIDNDPAVLQIFDTAPPPTNVGRLLLQLFRDHRMAVLGAMVIALFVLVAATAPLLERWVGHDPEAQDVFHRFEKPMTYVDLNFLDKKKSLTDYFQQNPEEASRILQSVRQTPAFSASDLDSLPVTMALMETQLLLEKLKELSLPKDFKRLTKRFQRYHLLGTDELGRDVFVRLIYGTRVSLGVGVLVALLSALVGLLVGCLAGFYGGPLDAILMRVTDSLLSLPLLPVLIVIAAVDFGKVPVLKNLITPNNQAVMKLVVILCLFSWMWVARLVRSSVMALKDREFVLAARSLGATDIHIITRHMIPNVIAPLLVAVTLGVGESILFEAALSYLGLGIQPPTPSWGNMLFNAQEIIYQAPGLAILPGLLIIATTISFNYIGDGLQAAIDPKALKR